jgi:hypothetical protein
MPDDWFLPCGHQEQYIVQPRAGLAPTYFLLSEIGRKGGRGQRYADDQGKEPSCAAASRAVHEGPQPGEFKVQGRRVHCGRGIPVPCSRP